jgi:integrase
MQQTNSTTRVDTLSPTVESHFRILYERQRLRGRSKGGQRKNYRINFRHFERYLGRPPVLDDLNDDTIGDVMQWIVDRPRAPRTANKFMDCMVALWRFLCEKGIIERRWPTVEPFPVPEAAPVAWLESELKLLWQACEEQCGTIWCVPASLWWHTMHAVIWDSGERIGAVWALPWVDVDLNGTDKHAGFIRFRALHRKGQTRDIIRPIHANTVNALREMRELQSSTLGAQAIERGRVFGEPFCVGTLYNRYKTLLVKAGLPADRSHKFHCIRKSVASWYEVAGGNATKLLDHSSRRVTARYLDPRIVGDESAADLLFRPEAGRGKRRR